MKSKTLSVVLIAFVIFTTMSSCTPEEETSVDADETSAASALVYDTVERFQADHKAMTESWDASSEESPSPTGYGGSIPFQRWELVPEIKTNFRGIAFSRDFKEDRGHVYAWDDLFETERTGENSPGACLTCKTTSIGDIFDTYGWDYASMNLNELAAAVHGEFNCFACHDPNGGALKVVQPAFLEAMENNDTLWSELSHVQQSTFTCAQCHSEYYFAKSDDGAIAAVVHPWEMGLNPEDQYAYYQSIRDEFSGDYTQPESGVRLIKAQHPDYEEFRTGIHAAAGLSCADCHLPIGEIGGVKTRSHKIASPLKTVNESCLSCHTGKTENWMIARVQAIQDSVFDHMRRSGTTIERAHNRIAEAAVAGAGDRDLEIAREMLRESQWYWDFSASANSHGFHNSAQAHDNFSRAADLAGKAIESVLTL